MVVHNATQRALRFVASLSPRNAMMNRAPTIGRKVMTEITGQVVMSASREHEPGDQRGGADQHGEGIMIEIAGLQPYDAARHVQYAGGHAVRSKPVDKPTVAAFPERIAEPFCRPHEDEVVQFVEVPL